MPAGKFPEVLTYWAPEAPNDYGIAVFADPIVVNGRWQDRIELVRSENGDEFTSKAVVFLDRDIESNGYIAHGTHADEPDPTKVGGVEVKHVATTRDMRYISKEVRAYL